ncbi:MAG: dethiobiotin synthase [Bacteroidales bacterium]
MNNMKGVYFITGIDTNVGKTAATGIIARELLDHGINVITQKMIQTGCLNESEDIVEHRRIMNVPLFEVDKDGTTCPYIFTYPCSPHLAAKIDNRFIDIQTIDLATEKLAKQYDVVLLEGAGGIMVPITDDYLTLDYMQQKNYPVILVTSGKLGSINHTLMTLELIRQRGLNIAMLVYNLYPKADEIIEADTLSYLKRYMSKYFPDAIFKILDQF